MYVGHPRQYDQRGRLLGKCEHCGQLVTQDHFTANPITIVNDYGNTVTIGNPKCQEN